MKTCEGCRHAEWKLTKVGRLHPSGDGLCKYNWRMPPLPACYYWLSLSTPKPIGGYINRRHVFTQHCPCWEKAK